MIKIIGISTWLNCSFSALQLQRFINSMTLKVQLQVRYDIFSLIIHEQSKSKHLHVTFELSWSQMFDPQRDTLIRWRPLGWKRAAVCFKSSFSLKLGTSPSPMVRGWPRCRGYSTLISMQTPSRCTGRPTASQGGLSARNCPPHTQTEKALCKHKHIMNPMQNRHPYKCQHTCKHTHIQSDSIWMHMWRYTHRQAGQKSAVLHVRPDAFSNSSTHKCIIRLF